MKPLTLFENIQAWHLGTFVAQSDNEVGSVGFFVRIVGLQFTVQDENRTPVAVFQSNRQTISRLKDGFTFHGLSRFPWTRIASFQPSQKLTQDSLSTLQQAFSLLSPKI
jgi:hypothetical protein